jgi:hypothetical protein
VAVAEGDTPSVPLVAHAPLQPFEAVQLVAFVDDHVSVLLPPATTEVGLALIVTVGMGSGVTVTVALAEAVPPAPAQAMA